jgi:glycosyltransferase involved in cell wall biosynthesis
MNTTTPTPHILIIADGRSPTAQSWITNAQASGFRISLISTFPCTRPKNINHFEILPIAFSRFSGGAENNGFAESQSSRKRSPKSLIKGMVRRFAPIFQSLRYWLGPLTLLHYAKRYQKLIQSWQPDLVHALRIPFEGMLGSLTPGGVPFVAATWGNDLTLHAKGSWLMQLFTKKCLRRAQGLTSDTQRDVRLAQTWGLAETAPTLVIPGSGGFDLKHLHAHAAFDPADFDLPAAKTWVVNPRGLRPGSVHQETFFAAIPRVLSAFPDTLFLCPGLQGQPKAEAWAAQYGGQENIHLLPKLSQPELWGVFKNSKIFVSPSSHDGTPNTLLEAMAFGCFPITGDIESLREWITSGRNGLLIDPTSPADLAEAIQKALREDDLRTRAAAINLKVVKTRVDQSATRRIMTDFYQQCL